MKVKISAETTGKEVIEEFIIPQVKNNGIVVNTGDVKIYATKKNGEKVAIEPENLSFVFNRE